MSLSIPETGRRKINTALFEVETNTFFYQIAGTVLVVPRRKLASLFTIFTQRLFALLYINARLIIICHIAQLRRSTRHDLIHAKPEL